MAAVEIEILSMESENPFVLGWEDWFLLLLLLFLSIKYLQVFEMGASFWQEQQKYSTYHEIITWVKVLVLFFFLNNFVKAWASLV